MTRHADIRRMLYEHTREELTPGERAAVDAHLHVCTRCSRERDAIARTGSALKRRATQPSEERSDEFWSSFAPGIMRAIDARAAAAPPAFAALLDSMRTAWLLHRRMLLGFSGLAAAAILAFVFWPRSGQEPGNPATVAALTQPTAEAAKDDMQRYLSRSKILLVGISNMKLAENQPTDITVERRASHELAQETRYLERRPLDRQSARLLNDLDKIFVGMSNIEGSDNAPAVRMIRDGIHRENLLFKVRMAEAMYERAQFVNVSDRH